MKSNLWNGSHFTSVPKSIRRNCHRGNGDLRQRPVEKGRSPAGGNHMMRYVLALDFGASSGRAMLAGFDAAASPCRRCTALPMSPFPRTANCTGTCRSSWRNWNRLAGSYAIAPYESIAIDTWGVDYGMLGADGTLLELPRHYRTAEQTVFCKRQNSSCRQRNSTAGQAHRSWRSTRCFSCFVSGTAAALTSVPRFCQCRICLRIC
mgnify:CR=1 FL=1